MLCAMKLTNRIAVVTGASRGIGAGVARRLAQDGAVVALVYKAKRQAAEEQAAAIRHNGGRAAIFQADVADERSVTEMAKQVAAQFGKIDILANVAGVFHGAPVGEISRDLFEAEFFNNTWSVIATTQAALPYFPSTGGSIVNVSTSLVREPIHGTAVYSAAKAAVETLTLGFAKELGARGIRVNAVAPAITRTDMTAGLPPDHLQHETSLTPLGRLAEPEDIADAVAFFASDDSRWITGRTILTDGGRM
jgi:3-oxoacyl-[acyl-carrier protein] reductase